LQLNDTAARTERHTPFALRVSASLRSAQDDCGGKLLIGFLILFASFSFKKKKRDIIISKIKSTLSDAFYFRKLN